MSDELNFNFDSNDEYEDIVSDSHRKTGEEGLFLADVGKKHARKKHSKFKKWWSKLSRPKKVLSIILCVVILFTSILVINPFHIVEHMIYNYKNMTEDKEKLGFESKIDEDIINIALFGIDTRNKMTFKGNSDSIMILSINTKTKAVKIMSVMRDTIVPITVDGKRHYAKINSAYAKSPETAIRTLNEIFDLDISEYATVNFYGMSEIIDAVGGVDITVTEDELRWKGYGHPNLNNCMDEICNNLGLNPNKYYIKSAGDYHANGIQAVAYSRVRNCRSIWGTNNDYGRTDRQRHVMEQLFNKAVKLNKSDYPKLASALIPCTQTSLEIDRVLSIAYNVLLNKPTFYQARIPQEDWLMSFRWSGYGSVVYYDLDYASKAVHSIIYEGTTMEEFVEANGVKKNDWFASIGSKAGAGTATAVEKDKTESSAVTSGVEEITDNNESRNETGSPDDTSSGEATTPSEPDTPSESTTSSDEGDTT